MSSCKEIRDLILAGYTDGELSPPQERAVEEHAARCSSCRSLIDLVENTVDPALRSLTEEELAPSIWEGIESRLETAEGPGPVVVLARKIRSLLLRPVPAGVAVVLAGAVMMVLFSGLFNAGKDDTVSNYLSRQMRFIDYMKSNGRGYPESDHLGLISPLEKYLFEVNNI